MTFFARLCLCLMAAFALAPAASAQELARYHYPLAPLRNAPKIVIDTTDAPDAQAWAAQAQALTREWFPLVCQLLATEHYKTPKQIKLLFKKTLEVPAYTVGDTISINNTWIQAHPDDFGMVIHELTHVVQSYPGVGDKPGWLVEGIADYVRWWRYEPEHSSPRVKPTASYRDSYRVTAAFLAWVVATKDRRLVPRLDDALRNGKYTDALWSTVTGKSLDDLWAEYLQAAPAFFKAG